MRGRKEEVGGGENGEGEEGGGGGGQENSVGDGRGTLSLDKRTLYFTEHDILANYRNSVDFGRRIIVMEKEKQEIWKIFKQEANVLKVHTVKINGCGQASLNFFCFYFCLSRNRSEGSLSSPMGPERLGDHSIVGYPVNMMWNHDLRRRLFDCWS